MSGTRRKPGRLDPFVAGYRTWLAEWGYTPGTIRNTLKVLGGLGRWMQDRDLDPADLTRLGTLHARCVGAAKSRVAELRSLLKFLYLRGLTARPLATAVPSVDRRPDLAQPSPSDTPSTATRIGLSAT